MGNFFCTGASDGVPHLEAWVRVGCGIPHVKGHNNSEIQDAEDA
jgi:hypothetical protein